MVRIIFCGPPTRSAGPSHGHVPGRERWRFQRPRELLPILEQVRRKPYYSAVVDGSDLRLSAARLPRCPEPLIRSWRDRSIAREWLRAKRCWHDFSRRRCPCLEDNHCTAAPRKARTNPAQRRVSPGPTSAFTKRTKSRWPVRTQPPANHRHWLPSKDPQRQVTPGVGRAGEGI